MDTVANASRAQSRTRAEYGSAQLYRTKNRVAWNAFDAKMRANPKLGMAAPAASAHLNDLLGAHASQSRIVEMLQQVQEQLLTAQLLHEPVLYLERPNTGEREDVHVCDVLKPTPARQAEKRRMCEHFITPCGEVSAVTKLSAANQALARQLGATLVDINLQLWQQNAEDNIALISRRDDLHEFFSTLRAISQRFSILEMAGMQNAFKLAQASPLGLFYFTETMTTRERTWFNDELLEPPFWQAVHQLYDRCQAIVTAADESPSAPHYSTAPKQATSLLAARLFLASMKGSTAPNAPLLLSTERLGQRIAQWNLDTMKSIPLRLLQQPALIAMMQKIERDEVVDPAAFRQMLHKVQGSAKAHMAQVREQFTALTAHTPALEQLIDKATQEAIELDIQTCEKELQETAGTTAADYTSPADMAMAMERRQQIADDLVFAKSGTYYAKNCSISYYDHLKSTEDWLLRWTPAREFVPEFINYGAGLTPESTGHNFIKTHLLPEAVASLGLDPDLPQLLWRDMERVKGVAAPQSKTRIEEVGLGGAGPVAAPGERDETMALFQPRHQQPRSEPQVNRSTKVLFWQDVPDLRRKALVSLRACGSFLQATIVKPATEKVQQACARFSSMRASQHHTFGFDFQQRRKDKDALKAIVDLRTTPEARVTGATFDKVNKAKVIIGPHQAAVLRLTGQHQQMTRTIVNQTSEPIVARSYWDATGPRFKAKAKGEAPQAIHERTVVTLDRLAQLKTEGIYLLSQDKPQNQ